VSSSNTATPSVTDSGDGTYSASYVPQVAGVDQVAITLAGTPISGSPYTSLVAVASRSAGVLASSNTSRSQT
jgi:hypothetical protein